MNTFQQLANLRVALARLLVRVPCFVMALFPERRLRQQGKPPRELL